MFALSMFLLFMSRRINPDKSKTVHHCFSSAEPDASEIQLPEHY